MGRGTPKGWRGRPPGGAGAAERIPSGLPSAGLPPHRLPDGEETVKALPAYAALNFITLMASKFCTPPPTRLVV